MGLSATDMKRIIELGANVIIDASAYTASDLKRFSELAAKEGNSITMHKLSEFSAVDLKRVSELSEGKVTLDLRGA